MVFAHYPYPIFSNAHPIYKTDVRFYLSGFLAVRKFISENRNKVWKKWILAVTLHSQWINIRSQNYRLFNKINQNYLSNGELNEWSELNIN